MRAAAAGLLLAACATTPATLPPEDPFSDRPAPRNRAAVAAAARELGCDPERVTVTERYGFIQAAGCQRVLYFEKGSHKEWRRVGADYDLPPEDDLRAVERRWPSGVRLEKPRRVGGMDPELTLEQTLQLHTWNPKVQAFCVLGRDGMLRACLVQADEAVVADVVAAALQGFRFQPATLEGAPVPVAYGLDVNVIVPRPDCRTLGSPRLQAQCERAVGSAEGPAEPEAESPQPRTPSPPPAPPVPSERPPAL